jgi:hypothetical protein
MNVVKSSVFNLDSQIFEQNSAGLDVLVSRSDFLADISQLLEFSIIVVVFVGVLSPHLQHITSVTLTIMNFSIFYQLYRKQRRWRSYQQYP